MESATTAMRGSNRDTERDTSIDLAIIWKSCYASNNLLAVSPFNGHFMLSRVSLWVVWFNVWLVNPVLCPCYALLYRVPWIIANLSTTFFRVRSDVATKIQEIVYTVQAGIFCFFELCKEINLPLKLCFSSCKNINSAVNFLARSSYVWCCPSHWVDTRSSHRACSEKIFVFPVRTTIMSILVTWIIDLSFPSCT